MSDVLVMLPALLAGAWITIQVTVLAAVLGFAAALTAGLGYLSQRQLVRVLCRTYVEVFRGTSALVQMFWIFFALPFFGIALTPLAAGVLALGLNIGAYGAEVVRGAVRAVPRGQWEAATALNMTPALRMRRVILPQAVVAMLPPMGNLLIELLKATSLVSLVTIADLTFQGQILRAATGRTTQIFLLILVLYFVMAQVIAFGVRSLERRVSFQPGLARQPLARRLLLSFGIGRMRAKPR